MTCMIEVCDFVKPSERPSLRASVPPRAPRGGGRGGRRRRGRPAPALTPWLAPSRPTTRARRRTASWAWPTRSGGRPGPRRGTISFQCARPLRIYGRESTPMKHTGHCSNQQMCQYSPRPCHYHDQVRRRGGVVFLVLICATYHACAATRARRGEVFREVLTGRTPETVY